MVAYGLTDVGRMRSINQDVVDFTVCGNKKQGIFLVCDGMGGANGGEVASKIAAETIMAYVKPRMNETMQVSYMKEILQQGVTLANREILKQALQQPSLLGMGTTLVCGIANGAQLVVANVGDSRAYFVSNNKIKQITSDHSLVNDLVKAGELSQEAALLHPKRNVITRALGADDQIECDIFTMATGENSYLLLCSDGLTNEVSDPELCYEILNGGSLNVICQSLISIANKRGGHDNITVLLAAF